MLMFFGQSDADGEDMKSIEDTELQTIRQLTAASNLPTTTHLPAERSSE